MLSIIVPCMNEEEAIPIFYKEILRVIREMKDETFEILFIDDGSTDKTLEIIKKLSENDKIVKYISFSRNFGKEAAMYAGLENAKGDYVAVMDVDLQDPPSLLPEMYKAVTVDGYDSVATRRITRKGEPPIRSFFARSFYKIMNKICKTDVVDGARDYRLMNRSFVNALLSLGEKGRFSKGLFGWVGFKTKWIEFENVERVAGETKWSFWKLFIYAIDGITAFSTAPLILSALVGMLFSLISFFALMFIAIRQLIFGNPVDGWASTICIILFCGGLQMFFIGVIGEYLAKLFTEVKNRPIYICRDTNLNNEVYDENNR